jgi:hypothetical protein
MPDPSVVTSNGIATGEVTVADTAVAITKPAGATSGRVAYVGVAFIGAPGTLSGLNTGWANVPVYSPTNTSNPVLHTWRKVLDGTSADDFALAHTVSRTKTYHYIVVQDADTTTPEDGTPVTAESSGALTADDPSVAMPTTSVTGSLILGFASIGATSGGDPSAVTGMTEVSRVSTTMISSSWSLGSTTAGAQSNVTLTTSVARRYAWIAIPVRAVSGPVASPLIARNRHLWLG